MIFFRKKNKTNSIDKHGERFEFEYRVLPSVATFSPCQLFTIDHQGSELLNFLFSCFDEFKGASWIKEYIANSSMAIYDASEGQISLLKLAEPETSPELAYVATVLPNHLAENMKDEEDIFYRPFYILAKMVDNWCFGEVKYVDNIGDGIYYTTYYKMTDKADPVQFIEWVMEREGLTKKSENIMHDPVADFLNNK